MIGAKLKQALFFERFMSCCHGLDNLASLFLPEQDVPFHCLAYNTYFDSFLDDHGQVFADVFFLFLDTVPKSSNHTACL